MLVLKLSGIHIILETIFIKISIIAKKWIIVNFTKSNICNSFSYFFALFSQEEKKDIDILSKFNFLWFKCIYNFCWEVIPLLWSFFLFIFLNRFWRSFLEHNSFKIKLFGSVAQIKLIYLYIFYKNMNLIKYLHLSPWRGSGKNKKKIRIFNVNYNP